MEMWGSDKAEAGGSVVVIHRLSKRYHSREMFEAHPNFGADQKTSPHSRDLHVFLDFDYRWENLGERDLLYKAAYYKNRRAL